MISNSDDETHFSHKLLLTNRQVEDFCKTFAINLSANIKLSKTKLSKAVQLGRYLGELPLELTAAESASAADSEIHKKNLGSVTHPLDLAQRTALIRWKRWKTL